MNKTKIDWADMSWNPTVELHERQVWFWMGRQPLYDFERVEGDVKI